MKTLKVYFQRAANLGDWLPPLLIERLFAYRMLHSPTSRADLVATGSVLETVFRKSWKRPLYGRFSPVVLWGPGFIAEGDVLKPHRIDPLMVRGPKSGARIEGWSNGIVGDPVLLADRILRGPKPQKQYAYGIIPHISDQTHESITELAKDLGQEGKVTIIDLSAPIDDVLFEIASCERVISTSLHGLVVADSFGISNLWIKAGDGLLGGSWKFLDYFAGINRMGGAPTAPVDITTPNIGAHILQNWDTWAMTPADLEPYKDQMMQTFLARWGA
jgi:pyruvyltransferase